MSGPTEAEVIKRAMKHASGLENDLRALGYHVQADLVRGMADTLYKILTERAVQDLARR
jgi:hypothetical protein